MQIVANPDKYYQYPPCGKYGVELLQILSAFQSHCAVLSGTGI
ncbi:MAG: hypothetical protein SFY80_17120 [Verrucomicrobiota bacterium]|nr:hypothetical protein [Verrucomicrobiota bacterium]